MSSIGHQSKPMGSVAKKLRYKQKNDNGLFLIWTIHITVSACVQRLRRYKVCLPFAKQTKCTTTAMICIKWKASSYLTHIKIKHINVKGWCLLSTPRTWNMSRTNPCYKISSTANVACRAKDVQLHWGLHQVLWIDKSSAFTSLFSSTMVVF